MAVECLVLVDDDPDPARYWFVSIPRIDEAMTLPNSGLTLVVHTVRHFPCPDGVTNTPPTVELQVSPQVAKSHSVLTHEGSIS